MEKFFPLVTIVLERIKNM